MAERMSDTHKMAHLVNLVFIYVYFLMWRKMWRKMWRTKRPRIAENVQAMTLLAIYAPAGMNRPHTYRAVCSNSFSRSSISL